MPDICLNIEAARRQARALHAGNEGLRPVLEEPESGLTAVLFFMGSNNVSSEVCWPGGMSVLDRQAGSGFNCAQPANTSVHRRPGSRCRKFICDFFVIGTAREELFGTAS